MLRKIIIVSVVALLAAAIAAAGYYFGNGRLFNKEVDPGRASVHVPAGSNNSGSSIGLSVASGSGSGAMSLGQLGAGQGQGQGQAAAGAAGAASSGVNPAAFAEYEKYKGEKHALFGDIVVGKGAELTASKQAAIYYKGWLTNGQMFDQSPLTNGQKQPFLFTLGAHSVVPGLEEGVFGMKVGGKRLIIIPPAVGYGEKGQGPVPPNAVMIFEVELLTAQ